MVARPNRPQILFTRDTGQETGISILQGDVLVFSARIDLSDEAAHKRFVQELAEKGKALDPEFLADVLARIRAEAVRSAKRADRARGNLQTNQPRAGEWPDPKPLPNDLPPVPPFDPALLPHYLRDRVLDVAERTQAPIEFAAISGMVALSAVVGRRMGICPKRDDDWLVVPNLWGAIIGRPGVMKSPILAEMLRPLEELERAAKTEFEQAKLEFDSKQFVAEALKAKAREEIREASKDGKDAHQVAKLHLAQSREQPPTRWRILVYDSTVEKLGELLAQNPFGLLLFRDELTGWLRQLEREGHQGDRPFYLECWSGTGQARYDRIGRGTLDIPSTTLSILGSIQPGPLIRYLRSPAGEHGDDGLLQRFQLMVWPDPVRTYRLINRAPDAAAKERCELLFDRLVKLQPTFAGAIQKLPSDIPFLRFDEEAQDLFDSWFPALELRLRSEEEHPVMEAHLAKYRSLVPSLALLLHLGSEKPQGPVTLAALKQAIDWAVLLEAHARRVYAAVIDSAAVPARLLAKRILKRELESGFTIRDVYRKNWIGLSDADDVRRAVELLEDLHWLREVEVKDTKPKYVYEINPKVFDQQEPDQAGGTGSGEPPSNPGGNGDSSVLSVPSGGHSDSGASDQGDSSVLSVPPRALSSSGPAADGEMAVLSVPPEGLSEFSGAAGRDLAVMSVAPEGNSAGAAVSDTAGELEKALRRGLTKLTNLPSPASEGGSSHGSDAPENAKGLPEEPTKLTNLGPDASGDVPGTEKGPRTPLTKLTDLDGSASVPPRPGASAPSADILARILRETEEEESS